MSNIKNYKYDWIWNRLQGSGFLNSKKRPMTSYENIIIFSNVKLGQHTYNPQIVKKEKDNIRIRISENRKPCGTTTYGAHNSKLSKTYENTKSYPVDIIKESSKQKECNPLNRLHPTQKPVALMEYLIKTYTNEGETVLDNVMGSGTTGVACKKLNRKFIGIEKDEKYFNIAKNRIEQTIQQLELETK